MKNEIGKAATIDLAEMLDLWDELRYPHNAIAQLAYWTGSRLGEVLPLSSECDRGKTILIYQKKVKRAKEIPVQEKLRALIDTLPAEGYWFPSRDGGSHISFHAFSKELGRAVELLGWQRWGIRTHTFRRSRATHLHQQGIPHKTIMRLTGHTTLASFERYLDADLDDLAGALEAIGG